MKRWRKVLIALPTVAAAVLTGVFREELFGSGGTGAGIEASPGASGAGVEASSSGASGAGVEAPSPGASGAGVEAPSASAGASGAGVEASGASGASGEAGMSSGSVSDRFVSRCESVSSHAMWVRFVREPGAMRVWVQAVEQIASGKRPLAFGQLSCVGAVSAFRAVERDGALRVSAESAGRFQAFLDGLLSVPVEGAAGLLREFEAEFERVLHEELGYPSQTRFRSLWSEALTVCLKTPVPGEDPALTASGDGLYRYVSAELEALPDAQKFLLRLGALNRARLDAYLRALWALY